jgi:hypothetical protein
MAQTMYTHMNKCKNNKILKRNLHMMHLGVVSVMCLEFIGLLRNLGV